MNEDIIYANKEVGVLLGQYKMHWFSGDLKAYWRDENNNNQYVSDCEDVGVYYKKQAYLSDWKNNRIDETNQDKLFAITYELAAKAYKKAPETMIAINGEKEIYYLAVTDLKKTEEDKSFVDRYTELCAQFVNICAHEEDELPSTMWIKMVEVFQVNYNHVFQDYLDLTTEKIVEDISQLGIPEDVIYEDLFRILNFDENEGND